MTFEQQRAEIEASVLVLGAAYAGTLIGVVCWLAA